MHVGLEDEDGGVGLLQLGLLVDLGGHVVLVVRGPAEVEGQRAVLLTHRIGGLHDVVATVSGARVLNLEKWKFDNKISYVDASSLEGQIGLVTKKACEF